MVHALGKARSNSQTDPAAATEALSAFDGLALQGSKAGPIQESEQGKQSSPGISSCSLEVLLLQKVFRPRIYLLNLKE